ncbi:Protein IQ-domain 1 [Apostasia shenzhenica]|uniref:Protein IQ-domain 1 n=1 Tax=Apostasia shenzhenica TaxID=1088818 RepID=A0A2I0A8P7_9ASPA|nr:Protein IQ-domain 1 [Apostasia shenzhenica]
MGKNWFFAVRKIFGAESKGEKSKRKSGRTKELGHTASIPLEDSAFAYDSARPSPSPLKQQDKALVQGGNGQSEQAYSVAIATAVAAEAAVAAARAAAEVVRLTASFRSIGGKSREEIAAVKIQAAYRGYLVRRGSRTMRGMVRLKLMSNSIAVKRQTMNTLHNMQTLTRVQSQVRERRIRLSEQNQSLHQQRQLKHEKELEKLKLEDDWLDSPQSKEQHEVKLQKRLEAAQRRQRTLAYAYSHQWRNTSSRSKIPAFRDPANPQWGWSWLERWMAARPWDSGRSFADRERQSDRSSIKSGGRRGLAGDSRRQLRPSPSTPSSVLSNDDVRSLHAFSSEHHRRRHSVGSSVFMRDGDILASSPAAKAKPRFQAAGSEKARGSGILARKRLFFPAAGDNKKSAVPPAAAAGRRLSAGSSSGAAKIFNILD